MTTNKTKRNGKPEQLGFITSLWITPPPRGLPISLNLIHKIITSFEVKEMHIWMHRVLYSNIHDVFSFVCFTQAAGFLYNETGLPLWQISKPQGWDTLPLGHPFNSQFITSSSEPSYCHYHSSIYIPIEHAVGEPEAKIVEPIPEVLNYVLPPFH